MGTEFPYLFPRFVYIDIQYSAFYLLSVLFTVGTHGNGVNYGLQISKELYKSTKWQVLLFYQYDMISMVEPFHGAWPISISGGAHMREPY